MMKPFVIIFAGIMTTVGCTSSNTDDTIPISEEEEVIPSASEAVDTDMIISAVMSVINTVHLKEAIEDTPTPSIQNSFTLIGPDAPSVLTFACPTTGTASVENFNGGITQYNDCAVDDTRISGSYSNASASGVSLVSFTEFSIAKSDSQLFIENGSLDYSESLDLVRSRQWRWIDTVYTNTTASGSIEATINNVNLERIGDDEYRAEFDATVTVDGTVFTVSTNTPFESQNGDRYYTSGQFQIENTDVLSILVDADGGDPNSALISVTSNGSTESEIRGWSDQFYVGCLTELWASNPTIDCN